MEFYVSVYICSNAEPSSFSQGHEQAPTCSDSMSNRVIFSLYLGGGGGKMIRQ